MMMRCMIMMARSIIRSRFEGERGCIMIHFMKFVFYSFLNVGFH